MLCRRLCGIHYVSHHRTAVSHTPQQIVNTAASFYLAADRSSEQRPIAPGSVQMLIVPTVVCRAFAIELYFKAIIAIEGGTAKGHDLATLFGRLSQSSQDRIRADLSTTLSELSQKIAQVSNAFVDWRYIYESQSSTVDASFLYVLAFSAKSLAEALLANLAPNSSTQ